MAWASYADEAHPTTNLCRVIEVALRPAMTCDDGARYE